MTEEKKEETTEEEAKEPVEEEKEEGSEAEEESTSKTEEEEIDYDAEREKEEKLKKPDPIRANIAHKEREAKRDEDIEEDDDKPVTRKELNELIQSTQQTTEKTLNDTNAVAIAKSLSSSDAEASAIVAKWRNRTFPQDMPLQEQLEEMHAAVNRKKLVSVANEAKRALKSSNNVSKDASGTHRDAPEGDKPKMSPADAKGIKAAGYIWNSSKQTWRKPLAKGKFLCMKDLKSDTWIE